MFKTIYRVFFFIEMVAVAAITYLITTQILPPPRDEQLYEKACEMRAEAEDYRNKLIGTCRQFGADCLPELVAHAENDLTFRDFKVKYCE